MTKFTGGCLCGAVRYEGDAEPIFTGACYCADCQKASGAGHVTVVAIPAPAVTFTGAPKTFTSKADNGQDATRGFCANCGGNIYSVTSSMPGVVMLKAGSLDDSASLNVGMNVFVASAKPWDPPHESRPSFQKMT